MWVVSLWSLLFALLLEAAVMLARTKQKGHSFRGLTVTLNILLELDKKHVPKARSTSTEITN